MDSLNSIREFLLRPFFIGLYIGLAVCLFIAIRSKVKQRKLRKEINQLKQHIQTKLEIEAETSERRKKEIEALKMENENLRITLQSYYQKPGRMEIRQLHIYQKVVEILTEKAPGFAQSWQSALKDGEEEIKRTERGLIPFIKKLLPGRTIESTALQDKNSNDAQ